MLLGDEDLRLLGLLRVGLLLVAWRGPGVGPVLREAALLHWIGARGCAGGRGIDNR